MPDDDPVFDDTGHVIVPKFEQALCVWGPLDGEWVDITDDKLFYGQSVYRLRSWTRGQHGAAFKVYIEVHTPPMDTHPDTAKRVKELVPSG